MVSRFLCRRVPYVFYFEQVVFPGSGPACAVALHPAACSDLCLAVPSSKKVGIAVEQHLLQTQRVHQLVKYYQSVPAFVAEPPQSGQNKRHPNGAGRPPPPPPPEHGGKDHRGVSRGAYRPPSASSPPPDHAVNGVTAERTAQAGVGDGDRRLSGEARPLKQSGSLLKSSHRSGASLLKGGQRPGAGSLSILQRLQLEQKEEEAARAKEAQASIFDPEAAAAPAPAIPNFVSLEDDLRVSGDCLLLTVEPVHRQCLVQNTNRETGYCNGCGRMLSS